jgi:hypothetical protein
MFLMHSGPRRSLLRSTMSIDTAMRTRDTKTIVECHELARFSIMDYRQYPPPGRLTRLPCRLLVSMPCLQTRPAYRARSEAPVVVAPAIAQLSTRLHLLSKISGEVGGRADKYASASCLLSFPLHLPACAMDATRTLAQHRAKVLPLLSDAHQQREIRPFREASRGELRASVLR